MNEYLFGETRRYLEKINVASGDYNSSGISIKEFSAGGHYAIELSSMNNPKILRQALKLAKNYQVFVDRVIECRGIVRLPNQNITEMVKICSMEGIGLILSVGPRATSDTGAFAASSNGKRIGYRLRGMENIVHAVEDVKRGIDLGVRGFLIYDEGLLYLLNRMRRENELPRGIIFKYSVHAGCSNPLSAKLLEENGADCINVVPDLDVHMLGAFRRSTDVPLDVFSDTAKSAGGLLRTYDVPEMIKYASPIYLKCGPISQPEQNHLPTPIELEERVKQARNVVEHIQRYVPEAKSVSRNEKTLALPSMIKASDFELVSNS